MAQRPLTSERATERRRQLLEAAVEMFGERDYEDVAVDDVAAAAGVSHGLVFQYFGTKRDLYVAGLEPLIEEFRARIAPDPALPPTERLRSAMHSYADFVSEHPKGYRSLMTRGVGFSEIREGLEKTRWEAVARIATQMGLDPEHAEVRVGLRAWIGYMDTAMLAWLDTGGPDKDTLVEMIVAAMAATAQSIGRAR
jgi:AcrR family transcriptional regulator